MTTFVLVHGAWGGSYGFRKVRTLLQQAGHEVFTPSLTGIGERSHLAHGDINLSTHIHDVRNTIFYEDLDRFVLLGFSYGGMVVTGLLNHIGHQVDHLVYLDAFVPNDGESVASVLGPVADGFLARANDGLIPPVPREFATPEETEWSNARRVSQPQGTFLEPVSLDTPLEAHPFGRTYIKASGDSNEPKDSPFWGFANAAKASDAWRYHEIDTGHMVPLTRPQELADILLGL